MGSVSAAAAFEAAFLDAVATVIDDPDVSVVSGYPYPLLTNDIVMVGQVSSAQEPGPYSGPRRPRSENLSLELVVSVYRYGGQETDATVRARARELLGAVEYQCRITDTTVGGTVIWCFMTEHRIASEPFSTDSTEGRVCEIGATFTAFARVTD